MQTILKTQIKWLQSTYGNALYFMPLFQLGKSIYYFVTSAVVSIIAWQFVEQGYWTQSVYEQLIIVASFLCIFLFKKEKQYALVPYISKLSVSKIRNYILLRELLSGFNFVFFPLVLPVLFLSNSIENSNIAYVYLFVCLWLMGLLLNLLTRIIKYYCIQYRFFFITTLSIVLAYSLILVLFFRTKTVYSYSLFLDKSFYIILLMTGIVLSIPNYFYVIKQELYQVYEGNHLGREIIRNFKPKLMLSNIFTKILLLKYLRCKVFKKFLIQVFVYAIAGFALFKAFDFKILGLGLLLGIYTLNILQFTVYISSNYFDGLYTKPISIKSLLFSCFYVHLAITTILFIILLFFIIIFDKQLILPLITIYLYMSGPMALFLLHNILFARRFNLFPVQSDFTIERTFEQKVIGIIAGISLLGCAALIHFFSTIACYIILPISLIVLMTHSYWMNTLYEKFKQRKYYIMENLRKI